MRCQLSVLSVECIVSGVSPQNAPHATHKFRVLLLNARTQPSFDQTDDGVDAETSLSLSLHLYLSSPPLQWGINETITKLSQNLKKIGQAGDFIFSNKKEHNKWNPLYAAGQHIYIFPLP